MTVQNRATLSSNSRVSRKSLVCTPTFLPEGSAQSEQDPLITRCVLSIPVSQQSVHQPCELSPLDVAIMNNRKDIMAELIQVIHWWRAGRREGGGGGRGRWVQRERETDP